MFYLSFRNHYSNQHSPVHGTLEISEASELVQRGLRIDPRSPGILHPLH